MFDSYTTILLPLQTRCPDGLIVAEHDLRKCGTILLGWRHRYYVDDRLAETWLETPQGDWQRIG